MSEKDPLRLDKSPSETDRFGDLYPQRRGHAVKFSMGQMAMGLADQVGDKEICGSRVADWLESDDYPLLKLMVSALKSQGCITDIYERHFSCDICPAGRDIENYGGYDEINNQAFICANNIPNKGAIYGTLLRQLITMFDVCTKKYDFNNARHLACTEVRKANLAYCNLGAGIIRPNGTLAIKNSHKDCVRDTAVLAMQYLKFVPKDVAEKAVNEVFDRCYNDLEPIGRRCHNKYAMKMCDKEKSIFGYS